MTVTLPAGVAPVKPEYIVSLRPTILPDDDVAEGKTNRSQERRATPDRNEAGDVDGQPPAKRQKLSGAQRKKLAREEGKAKKQRGANKGRKFSKVTENVELCWKIAIGKECEFDEEKCRWTHDIKNYLSAKSRDLKIPLKENHITSPPFITGMEPSPTDIAFPSLDFGTKCPVFEETGTCRAGLKCRFLGGHAMKNEKGEIEVVRSFEEGEAKREKSFELNSLSAGTLKEIRTKKYLTPIADEYLKALQEHRQKVNVDHEDIERPSNVITVDEQGKENIATASSVPFDETQDDSPDAPPRPLEKKRLNWTGKTYLAPLTTAGNLPFRRLCVSFGADITCGEMGLATSFLTSSKEEWSLVRRHPSEKTFGIQLAGNKPATLVPTAEIMAREFGPNGLDFVDLNCGCPIDLVFKNGAGSALLDMPGKLGKILIGMNRALGDIPLTLKIRTGVKEGRNTAHKLMPRLDKEWGASAITIHGRTRQQRYTKLADWDYIKYCVETLRSATQDDDLPSIPIFGGGDCYSAQSYWEAVESTGVDGVMVARGALIKPWIFTEIKERREWDISSRERLDIIRQFAEYGLSHFGSDTAGVNTTRRYLCEALSFQYRYVPIGLLERLPGKMNERPPVYRGRDELETMLASGDSRTWVKISEMFLGPVPDSWTFTPKHRSNSYEEETQG